MKTWEWFIIKWRNKRSLVPKYPLVLHVLLNVSKCELLAAMRSFCWAASPGRLAEAQPGGSHHVWGEQVRKLHQIYPAFLCPRVEISDGSSKGFRLLIFFNLSPYISTSFIRKGKKSIPCWNRLPPALLPNVSKSQWKGLAPDFSAGPINHSQKYSLNPTCGVNQQE